MHLTIITSFLTYRFFYEKSLSLAVKDRYSRPLCKVIKPPVNRKAPGTRSFPSFCRFSDVAKWPTCPTINPALFRTILFRGLSYLAVPDQYVGPLRDVRELQLMRSRLEPGLFQISFCFITPSWTTYPSVKASFPLIITSDFPVEFLLQSQGEIYGHCGRSWYLESSDWYLQPDSSWSLL